VIHTASESSFICRSGHEHETCRPIDRGVPPELRCEPEQPQGFGGGAEVAPSHLTSTPESITNWDAICKRASAGDSC
jgi:hypothetical protein